MECKQRVNRSFKHLSLAACAVVALGGATFAGCGGGPKAEEQKSPDAFNPNDVPQLISTLDKTETTEVAADTLPTTGDNDDELQALFDDAIDSEADADQAAKAALVNDPSKSEAQRAEDVGEAVHDGAESQGKAAKAGLFGMIQEAERALGLDPNNAALKAQLDSAKAQYSALSSALASGDASAIVGQLKTSFSSVGSLKDQATAALAKIGGSGATATIKSTVASIGSGLTTLGSGAKSGLSAAAAFISSPLTKAFGGDKEGSFRAVQ